MKIKLLSLNQAITFNESIVETTISKQTKKIQKIHQQVDDRNQIIKSYADLIHKANISIVTSLSERSIYLREYLNLKAISIQHNSTLHEYIEWLKNYVKSAEIENLWNLSLKIIQHQMKQQLELDNLGYV
ncbi:unnamed protein product [Paramecium octaurelia]|uniref:Uncharacterized protein n=1 Tax=Paramecium octaurelia TaxID=43137 RepID=A0A8S1XZZ3_PAROT|nr:unnamed protein product [Paramecium octaurelia]